MFGWFRRAGDGWTHAFNILRTGYEFEGDATAIS
jgi:hypothetical protein